MIRDCIVLTATLFLVSLIARLACDSRQSSTTFAHDLVERGLHWRNVADRGESTELDRIVHLVRAQTFLEASRTLLSDEELARSFRTDVPRALHETERAIFRARQSVEPVLAREQPPKK